MGTGRPIEKLAQLTLLGSTEQYFNKAFLSSFCIVNELKMIRVTVEDGTITSMLGWIGLRGSNSAVLLVDVTCQSV